MALGVPGPLPASACHAGLCWPLKLGEEMPGIPGPAVPSPCLPSQQQTESWLHHTAERQAVVPTMHWEQTRELGWGPEAAVSKPGRDGWGEGVSSPRTSLAPSVSLSLRSGQVGVHTLTHIHTHAHTHTHSYTHTHIHLHTHTHSHTFIHTHTYIHIHTHTLTPSYTLMHSHTHIHTPTHSYTHTHAPLFQFHHLPAPNSPCIQLKPGAGDPQEEPPQVRFLDFLLCIENSLSSQSQA